MILLSKAIISQPQKQSNIFNQKHFSTPITQNLLSIQLLQEMYVQHSHLLIKQNQQIYIKKTFQEYTRQQKPLINMQVKINKKNLFDMIDQEQLVESNHKSPKPNRIRNVASNITQGKLRQKTVTSATNLKPQLTNNPEQTHTNRFAQKLQQLSQPQQNPLKQNQSSSSFSQFPLHHLVQSSLLSLGYTHPTKIQSQTLPHSLINNDMLCLSQTGSGKTLSFVLPVVNYLCQNYSMDNKAPDGLALVLAPTRELCLQIKEYFDRFIEAGINHYTAICIHGGVDPMKQVIEMSKKPSVIVSTPGRLLDHLTNTKGFNLDNLKYLILDQADKLLNKDFQIQFNEILSKLPVDRNAYLYSATLTHNIQKLQRVSLKNPIRVQVSQKYQTVSNLQQFYIFIPSKFKDCYLLHLLCKNEGKKIIIFAQTKLGSQRISMLLTEVGQKVECLHGDMSQVQRIIGLDRFKKDQVSILVCTQVAARGLDINMVELVINYDLCDPKSYVHRVGRTARIGNSGISISIVTQYDVEALQKIQQRIGQKMKQYPTDQKQAQLFLQKLQICHHQVTKKMKLKHRKSQKMSNYK